VRLRSVARVALASALAVGASAAAGQTFRIEVLHRLLQASPNGTVRFQEVRESPWLASPIESRGRMISSGSQLEKIVEVPRQETWRILPDRLLLIPAGGGAAKELKFSTAPAAAVLARALRQAVAGDLPALENDFQAVLDGDERQWSLQLTPRSPETARFLKQLELRGAGSHLRTIIVLETQGERTTTTLTPEP